jgi:hypothetical protein
MRHLQRLVSIVRPLLRVVAIGLVVVGAVLMASWFEMLLEAGEGGISSAGATGADGLKALARAIPFLLSGLALLVLTPKKERIVSLMRRSDDA